MSALTTRILVLGVVRIFGPANGYQLRRELLSWEVERWAHLNPGSIYSMLGSLEKDGSVDRHDLVMDEGGRPVAVYTVTPAGDAEFLRLLTESIETVPDSGDALPLRVAVNFAPALTRTQILAALDKRIEALILGREALERKRRELVASDAVPPHVASELGLEIALVETQLGWLDEFVAEIRGGGLAFEGDPDGSHSWRPGPDDPGWRIVAESQEYAKRLGIARRT